MDCQQRSQKFDHDMTYMTSSCRDLTTLTIFNVPDFLTQVCLFESPGLSMGFSWHILSIYSLQDPCQVNMTQANTCVRFRLVMGVMGVWKLA